MDGYLPGSPRSGRMGHHALAGLRHVLRHLGPQPIVLLGLLIELGWACVGSFGLGLRPGGPGGPLQGAVWVGGTTVVALVTAAAAHLAAPERRKED